MKFQTTRKAIKAIYGTILEVGYCDLCHLLRYRDADAYTCGVYGWNADIYIFDKITIVTGYRPFGNYSNYDLVREYDEKAYKIARDYKNIDWETRKNDVNKLLDEFVNKVYELATAK
jgi:hypothetical protein